MDDQGPEYTEMTVLVATEAAEGLADVLLGLGARGVVEERRPPVVQVTAYLPAGESLEARVKAVRARLSALEAAGLPVAPGTIGLRRLGAKAWSEAWRDHFKVQRITPGLVIAPSWEGYQPKPGEKLVVLDPGTAFGTGGHGTTRLCLMAVAEHVHPGDRVADVGCGSGILAIAAAVLGASAVVAIDNDPEALPVARRNAERNGVGEIIQVMEGDLLPASLGRFDMIVCNIVATEVTRLAQSLPASLAPGGRFIGSGFLITSTPMVESALREAGLEMVEGPSEEGWAACVAVSREQRD